MLLRKLINILFGLMSMIIVKENSVIHSKFPKKIYNSTCIDIRGKSILHLKV